MTEQERQQKLDQLREAIEEDSKAIVELLQSCGSSRDFRVEQQALFEELLLHRRQLIEESQNFSLD